MLRTETPDIINESAENLILMDVDSARRGSAEAFIKHEEEALPEDVDALSKLLVDEQAHVLTVRNALQVARKKAKALHQATETEKPWEYCIVFPMKAEGDQKSENETKAAKISEKEKLDLLKDTVTKLQNAGLHTLCFWSYEKDEVYVQIRAPISRLQTWADASDRKMLLNPEILKDLAKAGNTGIASIELNNCEKSGKKMSRFEPYEHIYGKYDTDEVLQPLYKRTDQQNAFTDVLKLQLLVGIMGARHDQDGAQLQLRTMLYKGKIKGHFPLHNAVAKNDLANKWMQWNYLPWTMPQMKEYFGETIGMYFEFLSHYTCWIIAPSIVGFIVAVITWSQRSTESPLVAAFSLFIALWAVLMMEFWKRRQSVLQLFWGMDDVRKEQLDRPEFTGDELTSPIDGKKILYFPQAERTKLQRESAVILSSLIFVVLIFTGAVFVFRKFMTNGYAPSNPGPAWGMTWGSILGSVMMGIQINVMNIIYQKIAIWATNRENHRTDQEYTDSLIIKLFLFQFVNSYASFYFIAFIQKAVNGSCDGGSCMDTLLINLAIIFLVQLFIGNAIEMLWSYFVHKQKLYDELNSLTAKQVEASKAELEYTLDVYDDVMGPLLDYNTIVIQFGYLTLFVAAFPMAPLAALINNFAAIKMDSYKLIHMLQRPLPVPAQDIGTWQAVFNLLIILAVSTNAGLICFVMENVLNEKPLSIRVWAFVIIQYGMFAIMYVVQVYVPDVPPDVELQLKRADFLVSKIIERVPDDDDDPLADDEVRQSSLNIIDHDQLKVVNKDLFDKIAVGANQLAHVAAVGANNLKNDIQRGAQKQQTAVLNLSKVAPGPNNEK